MVRQVVAAASSNPGLSGGERGFVAVILVIALLALGYAAILVKEVLAADQGTPKMQQIAQAVQEGAAAYLNRQFKTLAVFGLIVFLLLLALPVNSGGFWIQASRAIFFVVG